MVKYDTSKPIHLAMDYTRCRNCDRDRSMLNQIENSLKSKGFNVVGQRYSPNGLAALTKDDFAKVKGHVGISLVNGADPASLYEVAQIKDGNYLRSPSGSARSGSFKYAEQNLAPRNNIVCMAYWYGSCDPVNPGGKCEKRIRGSETTGPIYNPREFIGKHHIPAFAKSDSKDPLVIADNIAKMFTVTKKKDSNGKNLSLMDVIVQFGWSEGKANTIEHELEFYGVAGESDINNNNNNNTNTVTISPDDTVSQIIIEETYTKAYFQQIQPLKTDPNGSFKQSLLLPYNGKYTVNIHYGGSRYHAPTTASYNIDNKGAVDFTPTLIEQCITTTTKEGKTTIQKEGDASKVKHTYTVRTTITYENGAEKSRSVETIQNDTRVKGATTTTNT